MVSSGWRNLVLTQRNRLTGDLGYRLLFALGEIAEFDIYFLPPPHGTQTMNEGIGAGKSPRKVCRVARFYGALGGSSLRSLRTSSASCLLGAGVDIGTSPTGQSDRKGLPAAFQEAAKACFRQNPHNRLFRITAAVPLPPCSGSVFILVNIVRVRAQP
ncbi:MAG: hypothetical protein BJ554DRAFT_2050 [Olpidium bornovanus]|uniref:Uncharacterized protein n=1 Tax=Olpidium bornovanus TaxID=278681 RepID=A0A8H7ZRC6_9FUNG|nr:MAG: hypothetical protein BJ554DRAFT_2050 [Olpidium bornovanus]